MKTPANPRVPRTRNLGTMTEAQFWGLVRSSFRETFRWWKPLQAALKAAGVKVEHRGRIITAYKCAACGKLFRREGVHVDHKEPAGSLRCYEDVGEFLRRLTPEDPQAFSVVCLKCHGNKTSRERLARENQKRGQLGLELPAETPAVAKETALPGVLNPSGHG